MAQELGAPVPPAALAAQEWINAGARSAYVVEAWEGRRGVMRADWYGAGSDEPIHGLIDQFMAASEGRIGGFPDVVAFWDDGRISLQVLKLSGKDALKPKQHQAADRLRDLLGARAQLSDLEWTMDKPYPRKLNQPRQLPLFVESPAADRESGPHWWTCHRNQMNIRRPHGKADHSLEGSQAKTGRSNVVN